MMHINIMDLHIQLEVPLAQVLLTFSLYYKMSAENVVVLKDAKFMCPKMLRQNPLLKEISRKNTTHKNAHLQETAHTLRILSKITNNAQSYSKMEFAKTPRSLINISHIIH